MSAVHVAHWRRSAHLTEAAEISTLSNRAGLADVQVWAAANARNLTPIDLKRLLQTVATVRDLDGGVMLSAKALQERIKQLRTIAAPPGESLWTDAQISASIDRLAKARGITTPSKIELMKSFLFEPGLDIKQRAAFVGGTTSSLNQNIVSIRQALGNEADNLRIRLAELAGMPLSMLAGRIKAPGDLGLTKRVINAINPSHREAVAKKLLSAQIGSDRDVMIYAALDAIFRGGNPFASDATLGKQLNQPSSRLMNALKFLRSSFAGERIPMLRQMGFSHEQIMSMNPVGAELSKRFDPALGTYSSTDIAARRAKNLPCSREEAAERLLRAGAERPTPSVQPLTYRSWVTLGMVSDAPHSMPADVTKAFERMQPNAARQAGESDLTSAFKVAQVLLNRDIPRGSSPALMDRKYRQEINLLLCQTFGLGATRLTSGRLESIPTHFNVSDWPAPNERTNPGTRDAPNTHQGTQEVTWQEVLPLLQHRSDK